MSRIARLCVAIMACGLIMTGFVGVGPSIAAAGNPSYCANNTTKVDNQSFGKKVPVILIHGFNGQPSDWGSVRASTDFVYAINSASNAEVAHAFKYNTLR